GQPNKRLYLFTDATRGAWDIPQADAMSALGKDLAKTYEIVHFNLSRPAQWNHAVVQLKPGKDLVRSGFPNDFQATVRGFGGGGGDDILQWKLDDQLLPGSGNVR